MSSIWNPNTVPTFYAQPGINVTVTNVAAARLVPAIFPSVTTLGYFTPGDGGDNTYNVVATGPADNGGTFLVGADGVTTRKAAGIGGQLNVAQWGCVNGVDSSARLQVAENWMSANGGGELLIPNGFVLVAAAIQWKSGVSYRGTGSLSSTSAFNGNSRMQVAVGGELFGYTIARTTGKKFTNLTIAGNGAVAGNLRGFWTGKDNTMGNVAAPFAQYAALATHRAERFTYENVTFDGFRQEGLMEENAVGTLMDNCFSQNCLIDATYLTQQRAAITCFTNDGRYNECEFASLPGANGSKVTSTNLYAASFWLAGKAARANSFVTSLVGELSDIGILVDQVGARLTNCRGDLNNGPGIVLRFQFATVVGGHVWNNSQDSNNGYDGFVIESTATGFRVSTILNISQTSLPNAVRYGFRNDVATVDVTGRGRLDNCDSFGHVTARYSATSPLSAGDFFNTSGSEIFLASNNVAPSVDGITDAATNNTAATVYSNFLSSNPNTLLRLRVSDANSSFANGATLKTNTGATVAGVTGAVYTFRLRNGIWYMFA